MDEILAYNMIYLYIIYQILCQTLLKEVDMVQNQKTMTLQNLTTLAFSQLLMYKGPHEQNDNEAKFD